MAARTDPEVCFAALADCFIPEAVLDTVHCRSDQLEPAIGHSAIAGMSPGCFASADEATSPVIGLRWLNVVLSGSFRVHAEDRILRTRLASWKKFVEHPAARESPFSFHAAQ